VTPPKWLYLATPRKPISTKTRKAFFAAKGGVCSLCAGAIDPVKEAWEIEHVIPIAMGGADEASNWELAHAKCHKSKTKGDMKNLAKAKRREAKHTGTKAPAKATFRKKKKPERIPDKLPLPPRRSIYQ
jgi:5-methylcytosine-specific restriction protein A